MGSVFEAGDDEKTRPDRPRASDAATAREPAVATQPMRIGPYLVLSAIGHGAMGMVFAAYDEKLDRKIALKLLHSLQETGTIGRARLLREAQALARVSHPNVVQVYEVGEHDREIYIAMEFVRGDTLRQWTRARTRGWREVLEVYLQAGYGLAAAHAAGVVHRDFKPDNVMIGDDGRVRVMDFGLARNFERGGVSMSGEATLRSQHDGVLSPTLTADGAFVGTPAYMAPEQYSSYGDVTAQADQFAFCVALFEALYGQRPFAGADMRGLFEAIMKGPIQIPARRGVPGWLRQAVTRGLAADPDRRWPGMTALLARVERGRAWSRLRLAGAALAVVGVAAVGGYGWVQAELAGRERACVAAGAEIAAVWGDDGRARLRESFARTGASDAADIAERVAPWLDRQAAAWQDARAETCRDGERGGVWSADALDRSLWCLDERRVDLESLVGELARADRAALQKAVPAAAALESVAACRDAGALARLPAPPAAGRDEARAVRAELGRSGNLVAAGELADAMAVATAALTRAEALAWPPLTVAAQLRVATLLDREGEYAEAERALEAAGLAAVRAAAFGVAADAGTSLVTLVGDRLARFDEGLKWSRLTQIAIDIVEPTPGLRTAANLSAVAVVRARTGDLAGARALQEQALALRTEILGPDHPQVAASLQDLASTQLQLGALAEALETNARALAICERTLGPDHGDVARTLVSRGAILRRLGKLAEALALTQRALITTEHVVGPEHPDVAGVLTILANIHLDMGARGEVKALQERALAIRERAFGPDHPEVATSLVNLGSFHMMTGGYERAKVLYTRALASRERTFGPVHRDVAQVLANLAIAEKFLDDIEAARPLQERALAIFEELNPPDHPDLAVVLVALAGLDLADDDLVQAKAHFERALAIMEKAQGRDHPGLEHPLRGLANLALAAGRPADAVPLAQRAVAVREAQGAPALDTAESRFVLARALWDAPVGAGRDRVRALAQARAARDAARGVTFAADFLDRVERWLTKHRL